MGVTKGMKWVWLRQNRCKVDVTNMRMKYAARTGMKCFTNTGMKCVTNTEMKCVTNTEMKCMTSAVCRGCGDDSGGSADLQQ